MRNQRHSRVEVSWTTIVDDFFTSSEFTGDVTTFCTEGSYSFGAGPAITIPLGQGCSGQFCFTGNLVTAYSSSHFNQDWSDGLSVACEHATVQDNTVIDATDVGIVLFRAYPAVQQSTVADNTILNAGNPGHVRTCIN